MRAWRFFFLRYIFFFCLSPLSLVNIFNMYIKCVCVCMRNLCRSFDMFWGIFFFIFALRFDLGFLKRRPKRKWEGQNEERVRGGLWAVPWLVGPDHALHIRVARPSTINPYVAWSNVRIWVLSVCTHVYWINVRVPVYTWLSVIDCTCRNVCVHVCTRDPRTMLGDTISKQQGGVFYFILVVLEDN